ncbi:substrate-binding domain-containing protein [Mesorhizobium sp. DCY119]|uniref:substrate-binding domain-containing protein n=1 Tax=Mesorhizobium sp. DCY119 TaxID=2108445 RepID=UPI0018D5308D|nr:substrate-binding domain-containing protein [Mesorhizobium sp. DCY119]
MKTIEMNRRNMLAALAAAGAGGSMSLAAMKAEAQESDAEYVFLSVVTQVPFWADHRAGLDAAAADLGVKTSFTGPLDFDTAGQARQLDELIARRPAGIMIFPGDAAALKPGIDRAVEAGIPVACLTGDVPDSKRSTFLGIANFQAGRFGGEMLAEAIGGKGKVLLGTFPAPSVMERVEGYKAVFAEKYPDIEVVDVVNDKADPAYAPPPTPRRFWRTPTWWVSAAPTATAARALPWLLSNRARWDRSRSWPWTAIPTCCPISSMAQSMARSPRRAGLKATSPYTFCIGSVCRRSRSLPIRLQPGSAPCRKSSRLV